MTFPSKFHIILPTIFSIIGLGVQAQNASLPPRLITSVDIDLSIDNLTDDVEFVLVSCNLWSMVNPLNGQRDLVADGFTVIYDPTRYPDGLFLERVEPDPKLEVSEFLPAENLGGVGIHEKISVSIYAVSDFEQKNADAWVSGICEIQLLDYPLDVITGDDLELAFAATPVDCPPETIDDQKLMLCADPTTQASDAVFKFEREFANGTISSANEGASGG